MPVRERQFSAERSRAISRTRSQISFHTPISLNSSFFNSLKGVQHDCVACVNKKLSQFKRELAQQKQQTEIKQHLQTIKRINSMADYQRDYRQKKLLETTEFNKSMLSSQKESQKKLKNLENTEAMKFIEAKQRQLGSIQENYQKSRLLLKSQYQEDLKNQLNQSRSKKSLQTSRLKLENSSQVNRLKILQENERYVQLINEEKQKCQRENKKLMLEKSYRIHEQKQSSTKEDKKHLITVEKEFQKFTEFQPLQKSVYRTSRTILSQNPEDLFTTLKRIQTEKTLSRIESRKTNNKERALELKKQEEENRAMMQKKIGSMKSYVEELTNQLLQKRKREAEQTHYRKYFKPQQSKVDYFTEELAKDIAPCHSCEKLLDKKYFGA